MISSIPRYVLIGAVLTAVFFWGRHAGLTQCPAYAAMQAAKYEAMRAEVDAMMTLDEDEQACEDMLLIAADELWRRQFLEDEARQADLPLR